MLALASFIRRLATSSAWRISDRDFGESSTAETRQSTVFDTPPKRTKWEYKP